MNYIQREKQCSALQLHTSLDADLEGYQWARDHVGQSGAAIYRLYSKAGAPELY